MILKHLGLIDCTVLIIIFLLFSTYYSNAHSPLSSCQNVTSLCMQHTWRSPSTAPPVFYSILQEVHVKSNSEK